MVLTLSNHVAVFHVILLFLQYCKLNFHYDISGHSLTFMELDSVLEPIPWHYPQSRKWFGVW